MRAAVVSHGSIRDFDYTLGIMRSCDMIICADGGAEYVLKCGLVPDVLIGDLDSISSMIVEEVQKKGCVIERYPEKKDFTDTQLAADYAVKAGADEIIMLGSTGDRLDHSLANIFLLFKFVKSNIKASIINEKNTIYLTDSSITLKGSKGDILSLLPAGGDVGGIYTEGLLYGLSNATIPMGDPIGVSNVFLGNEASIKISSGYLLVIKSRD